MKLFGKPWLGYMKRNRLSLIHPSLHHCQRQTRSTKNEMADIQRRQKNDKELIKKGYNRIQEKLKEIRQNFANAVTTGSRSGSGKIVLEFFDQLKQIWGGSPSTEPLSCGVSTDDFNDENENDTDPEIQCGSNSAADIGDHTRSGASQADGDKGFSEVDAANEHVNATGSPGIYQSFQFLARAMFTDNPGQPPYQYPPYQAPADVSDQVRMHGPVHPLVTPSLTHHTKRSPTDMKAASQTGMDNNNKKHFHSL
ncbi:hypothetical protein OS493_004342 [Desmophyllum pertusum]|uniref:Uncharacterized protein n=1 Tax=Desmophyllum pertusum TaxID=174260 RepID=A0A9W9ZT35_9CNID|nr:hypothetical protein OS493_004342 [Desmophyllum pertusum]